MAPPKELPQNRAAINQLAQKALIKVGEKPIPAKLYWLQLVRWGLSCGKIAGSNRHLLLFLELLEGSAAETVMEFFTGKERDLRLKSVVTEGYDPVDLARLLLIHLDCCMTEKVEGYARVQRQSSEQLPAESKIA